MFYKYYAELHNIFLDWLFQKGAQQSYFRADLKLILINEQLKKVFRANFWRNTVLEKIN